MVHLLKKEISSIVTLDLLLNPTVVSILNPAKIVKANFLIPYVVYRILEKYYVLCFRKNIKREYLDVVIN